MRVLLINQAFASPDQAGGTRHFELGRYCAAHGVSFTVVASDVSYATGKTCVPHHGLAAKQELAGIRVLRAYTYPSLHRSFVWRVVSFLSFMLTSLLAGLRAGPQDLVIGSTPPIFQAASAWALAFLRRCPFVLEIRDLWPEFAIDMGVLTNPLLIRMSRWLERFLYARARHIVVNSPAYRTYLIAHGVPDGKITVVPNGVDPAGFDPRSRGQQVREAWHLDGKFVVTYAGALGLANDLPTLLRAARRLSGRGDIHFLVVGDGKERRNAERISAEWGLTNVTFTGPLPKSRMPQVLAASDACVAMLQNIRMFRTTYPNKVFDYMAAGRPTVLAIDGVIRSVMESAGGGIFVPPGNDAVLAEAVRFLGDHPYAARAMGAAARDYAVRHFNRREQAEAFLRLLLRFARPGQVCLRQPAAG